MYAIAFERTVEEKNAAGPQQPPRATKQTRRGLPRRDVDHVDRDDGIEGFTNTPIAGTDIDRKRWQDVGELLMRDPGRDACARVRIGIARLPKNVRHRARG